MTGVKRERPFDQPWQAQVFAMTVDLQERGVLSPAEWADALGARVAASERGDGADYYACWVAALADVLTAKGLLTRGDVEATTAAWHAAAARTPHGQPILLD
ncbi:MAG: nitrile hydratase accessory protein [Dermatophilaceae bacterium]